jgi:hypothetical protein
MRKYFLIYISLLLLFSCSEYKKSEFEKGVELKYNSSCKSSNSCIVNIKEATSFSWDKMYVFKTTASLEIINEALGFTYPYYEDAAERVVFVKNNKVIYHDDYYPTFDDDVYTSLVFDLSNGLPYKSFSTDSAIFKIEKKEIENKQTYFVLSQ